MRVVFVDEGVHVRNYFVSRSLRWSDIDAVSVALAPMVSPLRRLGWLLEVGCRNGSRVSLGATINANRRTQDRLAAMLRETSARFGFQIPEDLKKLGP
jgi:hypothetical protein